MAIDLSTLTVAGAARLLRTGELTSLELTEAALRRADEVDELLGAFVTCFDDDAVRAAERADEELARGVDRGVLQGIPIGVKDILVTREGPTTAQSLAMDRAWEEGVDAPAISRLREAGAVIVGKTTTAEFAIGLPDSEKPFPIPRNPWDTARWPGGSSSGTAVGLAAGMFLAGVGTDTAGSIRLPAALCGVTGLMPTFGRVPKSGCVPLACSLDRVGPLARTADDCRLMLAALAGLESSAPTTAARNVGEHAIPASPYIRGLRIGVTRAPELFRSPEVLSRFDDAIGVLADSGAELVELELPPLYRQATAAAVLTMNAEASAYHRSNLRARWPEYGRNARLVLAGGTAILAADYLQAQGVRRRAQQVLDQLFRELDVIAMPTASAAAPAYGVDLELPMKDLSGDFHTAYWNSTECPVLALPMGFTRAGLPLSLQVAGRPFEDRLVMKVGSAFQTHTDWHSRRVPAPRSARPVPATRPASGGDRSSETAHGDSEGFGAVWSHLGLSPTAAECTALATILEQQQETIDVLRACVVGLERQRGEQRA